MVYEFKLKTFMTKEAFLTQRAFESFIMQNTQDFNEAVENPGNYLVIKKIRCVSDDQEQLEYRYALEKLVLADGKGARKVTIKSGEEKMPLAQYFSEKHTLLENSKDDNKSENSLIDKIRAFVEKKNAYAEFNRKVNEKVLGQPNLNQITYNVFMWLKGLASGSRIKQNAMVVAPSGCGKTETYRVIKEILNKEIGVIPIIQLDTTKLTTEGFSGKNTDEFFAPLFAAKTNGIGIVVLDEVDKSLTPRHTSAGDNVSHDIQGQLLTILEGTEFERKDGKSIDTNNTLFIASGAFQHIRMEKARKELAKSRGIGFTSEAYEEYEPEMADISAEDLLEYGTMPEFLGRFSTFINLKKLDRDTVGTIVKRYTDEYARQLDCFIELDEEAIDYFFQEYTKSCFGCRCLKNKVWGIIAPVGMKIEENPLESGTYCIKIHGDRTELEVRDVAISPKWQEMLECC